jgi:hypothetical protein
MIADPSQLIIDASMGIIVALTNPRELKTSKICTN